jgi:sugar lactone lactonase YvrE
LTVDVLFEAGAQLAEGPVWDPLRRSLTWVDILEGAVHRLGLDGTPGPTGRR